MEFIPRFIQQIQEKYDIDAARLNSLWTGVSSEKLTSTYRIYWKHEYNKLKKEKPVTIQEAMKQISASWKKLSKPEKDAIYQTYIYDIAVKYLPGDLSKDDAHEYFESKDVSYLRKMVSSFYVGEEDTTTWSKEKCILFLVESNETE